MVSSVLISKSLEQLLEVGRSGIEGLVKIPEGKGKSEAKKTPRTCMFGSASLVVINKAVPKTLIQSSALLNCDNGP